MSPTSEEWAYMAGLFDGEGTVRTGTNKHGSTFYRAQIGNTNQEVLLWLTEISGVGKCRKHTQSENPRWKQAYVWALDGMDKLLYFLEGIRPYVIIKRGQVEVMITLLQHRLEALSINGKAPPTVEDRFMKDIIQILNRKGVKEDASSIS